jgi:hypothetical protein
VRSVDKKMVCSAALRLAAAVGIGVAGISLAMQAAAPAVLAFLR